MLADLRILEVASFLSTAWCTRLLANLGATVLKVELPEGDPVRRYGPFPANRSDGDASGLQAYVDAGKRGVTIDYRVPTGRELLLRLMSRYDVVVFGHDYVDRTAWHLSYEDIRENAPASLVYCSLSTFGDSGPFRHYRGDGIIDAAGGGIALRVGEPDRQPLVKPLLEAEFFLGLQGAGATLMAVMARDRDGSGQHVDISGMEAYATIVTGPSAWGVLYEGRPVPQRGGYRGTFAVFPWVILPCRDGYFELFASNPWHWRSFMEVLLESGFPDVEFIEDARYDENAFRVAHASEIEQRLRPWFAERTKAELVALFRPRKIPFHPVHSIDDVMKSDHIAERGFLQEMEHPSIGRVRVPRPPYVIPGHTWPKFASAPTLGEHTDAVLREELGLTAGNLASLRRHAVV